MENRPQPKILRRLVRTRDTAKILIYLAEEAISAPPILYKAREITRQLAPNDHLSEALACLYWVREHVRFARDPDGIELVIGPVELLRLIEQYGSWSEDCDGQNALLYSLLRALGHWPRFSFVSFTGAEKIDHVFTEDLLFGKYVILDPILKDFQVGTMIGLIKRKENLSILGAN